MIRKNGKAYVIVEFDDEGMAEKFEEAVKDRYLPGVEEALVAGSARIGDEGLSLPNNSIQGTVTGLAIQAGNIGNISGGRVR